MRQAIERWLDRNLPAELLEDEVVARRAGMVLRISVVTTVGACAFLPVLAVLQSGGGRIAALVATTAVAVWAALTPLVLKKTASVRAAAHWVTAAVWLGSLFSITTGGASDAPFLTVMVLCPVMAAHLGGPRVGLAWSAACVASYLFVAGLETTGVSLPDRTPEAHRGALSLINALGLVIVLGILTWSAEAATQRATRKATEAADRRERAEVEAARAAAASEAKTAFLAMMSHELRTPLNAIIGYAELISEELAGRGEVEGPAPADLERIRSSARHLLTLISGVLDLTRFETTGVPVEAHEFRIDELVREVADELQHAAVRNRTSLTLDIAEGLPRARTDAQRVRQVVSNLVENAVKFTEDGQVKVRVRHAEAVGGGRFEVTVTDTGVGIPAQDLASVFEPFQQADSSSSRRYGGAGLGLAISKRLAELLGGALAVTSQPGRGTTFVLWVPAELGEPPTPEPLLTRASSDP